MISLRVPGSPPSSTGGASMSFIRLLWLPALIALTPAAPIPAHRHITFQQRVEAQRAIERVYYSHQDGATQPFDRAITNELLERKVRAYLGQSIACLLYTSDAADERSS